MKTLNNMEIDFLNDKNLLDKEVSVEGQDLLSKLLIKDPK
jgi:hypothetical protein